MNYTSLTGSAFESEFTMGTIGDFGQIALKWDPKNLEIRTMSVEKTLEPLVLQVTTLVNTKGPSKKKKGMSLQSKLFFVIHELVLMWVVQGVTAK